MVPDPRGRNVQPFGNLPDSKQLRANFSRLIRFRKLAATPDPLHLEHIVASIRTLSVALLHTVAPVGLIQRPSFISIDRFVSANRVFDLRRYRAGGYRLKSAISGL